MADSALPCNGRKRLLSMRSCVEAHDKFPIRGKLVEKLYLREGVVWTGICVRRTSLELSREGGARVALACESSQKLRFRFPCVYRVMAHAKASLQEKSPSKTF